MRKMLAFVVTGACSILSAQTPVAATSTCPAVEVSVVADKPADSTRSIPFDQGGRIYLTEKPLLTFNDLADASVSPSGAQSMLNVGLTADSAKRVEAFTQANVGKTIALVVDRRVLILPQIVTPIAGKSFVLGPVRADDAHKVADAINHKASDCQQRRDR